MMILFIIVEVWEVDMAIWSSAPSKHGSFGYEQWSYPGVFQCFCMYVREPPRWASVYGAACDLRKRIV